MAEKIKGIDISNYQGRINKANFKKAINYGIEFVILKCGYTGYSAFQCKEDTAFEYNYKNAVAVNLPVGVYYYSLANGPKSVTAEANFVVKQLKGKKITCPVYLDMEDSAFRMYKCSKAQLAEIANTWCKIISKAGYTPGIYASTSWFNNKIGKITEPHTKWVAQYYKKCEYKGAYDIWQYSSSESVPGVGKRVDVNWAYKKPWEITTKNTIIKNNKEDVVEDNNNYKLVSYTGQLPMLPKAGYIKKGDFGRNCALLQSYLNWFGSYDLKVDGIIGRITSEKIKDFQKAAGLKVDGKFGKKSLEFAKDYRKKVKISPSNTSKPTKPVEQKGTYPNEFPTLKIKKTTQQVIDDTVAWAKMIAADNRFHYGYTNSKKGINAHHNGCYFCHTQGKNKNGILDKEFSYCCNPFIHAAWSHGGQVPSMLAKCKKGDSYGFSKSEGYEKSKLFKKLGHPKKSYLQPGDVMCNNSHVAMYVGNGKLVEASGGDNNIKNSASWNNSIRVKDMSDSRYSQFPRVYRFIGIAEASHNPQLGDISDDVKRLQGFLNWYGNYKLKIDGKFMDNTEKALKDFQKKEGLKQDGICGPATLEKMKNATKNSEDSKKKDDDNKKKTKAELAVEWGYKIINTNKYRYKKWKAKDIKTHQCPICHPGSGDGWNCIGFTTACYYHGAELKNLKCSNAGFGDDSFFTNVTEKSWQERNGKNWQMISTGEAKGKSSLPQSKLKKGDVIICYKKNGKFHHIAIYTGNGKYIDSTSGRKPTGPGEGKYSGLAKRLMVSRAFRYVE